MSEFVGVIPAAGEGSRLGLPYPKELHSIEPGILYIDYALMQLRRAGITTAYVVVSPEKLTPMASALMYERLGVELIYVETQPTDSKSLAGSVIRGCRRANYCHDRTKFAIVLPDTKMENLDAVVAVTSVDPSCLGLFDVQAPQEYDAVYGTGQVVRSVAVKQPVDYSADFQGIWGCMTLDYAAVTRLRRIMRATPRAEGQSDHHLLGELINADAAAGAQYFYLKTRGEYTDLGDWNRVHSHVASIVRAVPAAEVEKKGIAAHYEAATAAEETK